MRIGRFQVIEPLAGQGDRRVLAAYDPRLDRKVAIELGAPVDASEAARAARRQQARAMARLGHPNVVRVHEVGEHEGELFVATDFVRGGTLGDWCREHPPGTRERFGALLELMMQATRGLAAAHAAEVVGLPLRLADMVVDDQGRLRLRGWTVAEHAAGHEPTAAEPDAHDDQRALCRTFWEAALGSAPAAAGARDEPAATPHPEVPAWFLAVLRRGMAPERRDRWPHVDVLHAALARGRDGRRRRIAALLGVAGVLALVIGLLRPSARDGCPPPDDAPSHGWPTRREALEQRFAASVHIGAHGYAVHTIRRLDELVTQWDAEHLAACTRANADPRAHARLACLERAATSFGVVLDEIERLEPTRLRTASSLTLALPELAECRDPGPAVPDVNRDATVHAATRRLAEATTLVNLRRVAKAEEIVAGLEAEGWAGSASVESRGRLVLASAAYARGDYGQARSQAFAALRAAEQGDHAGEAATAWGAVGTAELARNRLDEAAFAAERVESLAAVTGDALLMAEAKQITAGVEIGRGRLALAVASFEVAEQHLRAELGDHHMRLATLRMDMVPALAGLGRLEQAVEVARTAVAMMEALVGPESLRTVRAHGGLGIALAELGERNEAIEELRRAVDGMAADPDAAEGDRFILGLRHAEQLGLAGRSDEAVAALERVKPPPGDPEAAMVRAMTLGTVLLEGGRAAEASTVYQALLVTLEREGSRAAAINRAITHVNLAAALAQSGRAAQAVTLVAPTIAAYEALDMPTARLGNMWIEFAHVYQAAGRPVDARQAALRGLGALERSDATPRAMAAARAVLAEAEAALQATGGP